MADHISRPFGPIGINQTGDEPYFREFVHKPADRPLDICKVFFGDLTLWIVLTDTLHPKALPGDHGITKLPNPFGLLILSPLRNAHGRPLSLAWVKWEPSTLRRLTPVDPGCTGFLQSLWLTAWSRRRLATARVPRRSLREPSLPRQLFGSTTTVLASGSEAESVDLLCQALQFLRT